MYFYAGGLETHVRKCDDLQQARHHLPQGSSKTVTLWNEGPEPGMKAKVHSEIECVGVVNVSLLHQKYKKPSGF